MKSGYVDFLSNDRWGLYTTNSRKGVFKLVDNDKSMYSNDENEAVSFKQTLILEPL